MYRDKKTGKGLLIRRSGSKASKRTTENPISGQLVRGNQKKILQVRGSKDEK